MLLTYVEKTTFSIENLSVIYPDNASAYVYT